LGAAPVTDATRVCRVLGVGGGGLYHALGQLSSGASSVWYDTDKVIGRIGYVPIEEYAFFVLQSLMMGLWMHTLNAWLPKPQGAPPNNPRFRYLNTGVLFVAWLVCWYLLLFGGEQWTYFGLILTWAIFPIMIQTFFGADILWHRRGLIFVGILTGTSYLATADAIAIDLQIWTINPDKTLSILLGGVLPKEEALFFLVTNILIVLAMTFTLEQESFRRLDATLKTLRLRHPNKPIWGQAGQD